MVTPGYWSGKNVLVTGHTGFKGTWLCHWLSQMSADVVGYALAPMTPSSMFETITLVDRVESIIADINDREKLEQVISRVKPDVIFHLAAQALVRASYGNPMETFETNVMGTANLLQALCSLEHHCDVVIVTSDKCYLNIEQHHHYEESDPLGGSDPYSASKACAEIVTSSFRSSYFSATGTHPNIHVASARAGNVIGGGDWAQDRLIPDAIKAWLANDLIKVRNPESVRPWQHVLEPLSGYILLAQKMREQRSLCRAWNFGPEKDEVITVAELLELARQVWPDLKCDIKPDAGPHEAGLLMLDPGAARHAFGWRSKWNAKEAVQQTFSWYDAWHHGDDMMAFTSSQISNYVESP
ncbi:MAG: CDP-glucose 4,6-dehydratase [Proteobacteria bacterium]|nr:CDP-glucose 4,6-dehydratase [Pseudomonadota bacterium]